MTTYLLDANVLIALTVAEHEHHERASRWAAGIDRFAVCPIVEGALIRFLIRLGEATHSAAAVLREVRGMSRCEFWPDSLSYRDASLDHVRGPRQVTDAYLASLASANGGVLATLDEALAAELADAVVLIPAATG
ncbi:TA system VapC family ribonuclease toxin [Jiangella rhizosphaerae]|uniref:Ribonuclease VapC n=1 Tax=Jiangella rhizosphaerae TaxID=2293569 RepID=A0A418KKT0_9ACTN|nr:TA system VapC family ribonuclease toxin [Jiangella rhizosphaerae]RIQ16363.1 PIN domain-containing protein [Jiangella rhizosphaerae]